MAMQQPLFFAHANGFPGRCYHSVFAALSQPTAVYYLEKSGHHPDYPVTDNWAYLIREYLDNLTAQCGKQPVIGVGHSLGGVLTLYAALLRPQAFHGVILLDPPLCNTLKGWLFYALKRLHCTHWVTPGRGRVRQRRNQWDTIESAQDYFSKTALFQRFPKIVLDDFIQYGLKKTASGYQLQFDPDIEAEIFSTLPHAVARDLPKLSVPGYFLYGQQQSVVNRFDRWLIQHRTRLKLKAVTGTHLFPLEYPIQTASVLDHCIATLITTNQGDDCGKNLVEELSSWCSK